MPKQPKREYYSLSKEDDRNIGDIDTNVIYINEQDWIANGNYGSKKEDLYVFMKFASNGIAFYSDYSELPFTAASALIKTGQYCRYRVINDEVQLEFYDHVAKHFKIWSGKIYKDKIQFYAYKLKVVAGAKGKLNFTFAKSQIKYSKPLIWPQ